MLGSVKPVDYLMVMPPAWATQSHYEASPLRYREERVEASHWELGVTHRDASYIYIYICIQICIYIYIHVLKLVVFLLVVLQHHAEGVPKCLSHMSRSCASRRSTWLTEGKRSRQALGVPVRGFRPEDRTKDNCPWTIERVKQPKGTPLEHRLTEPGRNRHSSDVQLVRPFGGHPKCRCVCVCRTTAFSKHTQVLSKKHVRIS